MDCDGVLTDGRLYFSALGEELKVFDVRDGQGIVLWHGSGRKSGIISGRAAGEIIQRRADELGMEIVHTSVSDKVAVFESIIDGLGVGPEAVCYVGDDVGDIELMRRVGLPVAVADAVEDTKRVAKYVTNASGGRGAVREVIDMLLAEKAK